MAGLAVPNRADVAYAPLAEIDSAHFKIALAGLLGTGVVSNPAVALGCNATATGTDRNITITAGTCSSGTSFITVAQQVVTPTAGDATYGRFDLIVTDVDGVVSVV